MPPKTKVADVLPNDLSLLDSLIQECYGELLKGMKENAKLGDFIRMIQLRRELAPAKADDARLWEILEGVRQRNLPTKKKWMKASSPTKTTRNRKET